MSAIINAQSNYNTSLIEPRPKESYWGSLMVVGKGMFEKMIGMGTAAREVLTYITPAPIRNACASFLDSLTSIPQTLSKISPELNSLAAKFLSQPNLSRYYTTEGITRDGMAISYINGMGTDIDWAKGNAEHLRSLGANQRIEGIYNHSNGAINDLLEILTLNYLGYSPETQDLLVQKWTDFYEKNKNNPDAKCLHFCHSQGALHTKNALMQLPKEIRDRIIVVAIAPATVIPANLCYQSYNYASTKDVVPYGQDIVAKLQSAFGTGDEAYRQGLLESLLADKNELIYLDPSSKSEGVDHDFRSPTYDDVIRKHIEDYQLHNGQYK